MCLIVKRFLSFGLALTLLTSTIGLETGEAATNNAHGRIYNVSANGGSNSGTVSWKVEYFRNTVPPFKFGVTIHPEDHPFNTPIQTVSCSGSPCSFYIPTPKAHTGKNPTPLEYFFVVFASNGSAKFASGPSSNVVVKFAPTEKPSKTPTSKPSKTPTPKPSKTPAPTPSTTPTPTPSAVATVSATPTPSTTSNPLPKAPSISDFDGSYSGFLNVSLTPAILPTQVIPFSLKLINGSGQGQGGSWRGSGVVNDAQGNAIVTIAHAIYGSFSVPIAFSLNNSNQKKTGTGSGRHTVVVRGFGEITFDFTFTLSTK